jgi:hypothetical protein
MYDADTDGWVYWETIDTPELGGLAVAPAPCTGDLDGDNDVDSTDLNILLSGFGCTGGGCPGDIDGDGDTDTTDLNIVLSAFGTTCP